MSEAGTPCPVTPVSAPPIRSALVTGATQPWWPTTRTARRGTGQDPELAEARARDEAGDYSE